MSRGTYVQQRATQKAKLREQPTGTVGPLQSSSPLLHELEGFDRDDLINLRKTVSEEYLPTHVRLSRVAADIKRPGMPARALDGDEGGLSFEERRQSVDIASTLSKTISAVAPAWSESDQKDAQEALRILGRGVPEAGAGDSWGQPGGKSPDMRYVPPIQVSSGTSGVEMQAIEESRLADTHSAIDEKLQELQMDFVPAGQSHEVSAEYGEGRLTMRANNPGAIKWVSNEKARFRGTVGKTKGLKGDFAVYGTPEAGFEANSNLLDTHVYRYPEVTKGTVAGVIIRYAPYTENEPDGYIADMQRTLEAFGLYNDADEDGKKTDKFDSRDPKQHAAFLIGVASIESGFAFPWSKESLIAGMRGAGQQQDRDVPMFSTEEIDDLEKNLSIDRKDGKTTVTLYGKAVEIGGRGAKA